MKEGRINLENSNFQIKGKLTEINKNTHTQVYFQYFIQQ